MTPPHQKGQTVTKQKSIKRMQRDSAAFLVIIVTNVIIGLWRVNPQDRKGDQNKKYKEKKKELSTSGCDVFSPASFIIVTFVTIGLYRLTLQRPIVTDVTNKTKNVAQQRHILLLIFIWSL